MINEQIIQDDVNKIKQQFTETKAIYREVCMLLFFRYGLTPTANKLYQYVHRGSMSAPAEALNKFWVELRSKSKLQLDHPDLPENLRDISGELISKIWAEARTLANETFVEVSKQSSDEIERYKLSEQLSQEALKLKQDEQNESIGTIAKLNLEIESLKKRVSDNDYLLKIKDEALNNQENAFKALKNEYDTLANSMLEVKASFSRDLEAYTLSLKMSDDRYTTLQKSSLLEVDRNRQEVIKLQKDIGLLINEHQKAVSKIMKEKNDLQKQIFNLQNKLSIISGKYSESTKQNRNTVKELNKLRLRMDKVQHV
jgi:chromosome segregation ATPase